MLKVVKMDDSYVPENKLEKEMFVEVDREFQIGNYAGYGLGQVKSIGAILIEMQDRYIRDEKTVAGYGETMPNIDITLTRYGDISYFVGNATASFMGKSYGVSWVCTIDPFWKLEHNFESAIYALSRRIIDVAQEAYRLRISSKEE